jgi:EAL domain-containing protein (putative c-di-GMP-specific phosphodiesterase class I)
MRDGVEHGKRVEVADVLRDKAQELEMGVAAEGVITDLDLREVRGSGEALAEGGTKRTKTITLTITYEDQ